MSCPFSKASPCPKVNPNALKSEIRQAIINEKVNACPMTVRVAWHASGTYDNNDKSGGSNGATMRFAPEANDPANAGLSIIRDMLHPVQVAHPDVSAADLWTVAGAAAVEFCGGPAIKHNMGRVDAPDASYCPPNGRLPDAAQGAQHLRDVFYRMGFNDQDIVALSGAHTLGRAHLTRSGFDGPWTKSSLTFNNEYFTNLLNLTWRLKQWDGPAQYEDAETQSLMMLPTDYCLITDPVFRTHVERYAADEQAFFKDFADAYERLLSNGCPESCKPSGAQKTASSEFREYAMHGSIEKVKQFAPEADVHEVEASSGRTALHKAAFWGHTHLIEYLAGELKIDVNVADYNGDTAIHDAARFAHAGVVELLVKAGADLKIKNKQGLTPLQVAEEYSSTSTANKHDAVVAMLRSATV